MLPFVDHEAGLDAGHLSNISTDKYQSPRKQLTGSNKFSNKLTYSMRSRLLDSSKTDSGLKPPGAMNPCHICSTSRCLLACKFSDRAESITTPNTLHDKNKLDNGEKNGIKEQCRTQTEKVCQGVRLLGLVLSAILFLARWPVAKQITICAVLSSSWKQK